MAEGINENRIAQVREHWEVHINGEFFCSADTYKEAVKEIREVYG